MIEAGVRRCASYTDNVEFSAEDASRSDRDFLCRVTELAIRSGATTINLPDTVGYAQPDEFADLIRYVIEHTDHAVLGTADASGTPYAVPVTPFLFGGRIYFHGTKNELSRKRVNIQQNSQVSLAWIGTSPINPSLVARSSRRILESPMAQAIGLF